MDKRGNPIPLPPLDNKWLSGPERALCLCIRREQIELQNQPLKQREPRQPVPDRAERDPIPPREATADDDNPGFNFPEVPGDPDNDPNDDFDDDNPPPDLDKTDGGSDEESDTDNRSTL
jgi:hypothetical protein